MIFCKKQTGFEKGRHHTTHEPASVLDLWDAHITLIIHINQPLLVHKLTLARLAALAPLDRSGDLLQSSGTPLSSVRFSLTSATRRPKPQTPDPRPRLLPLSLQCLHRLLLPPPPPPSPPPRPRSALPALADAHHSTCRATPAGEARP